MLAIAPGFAIMITVLAINFVGDALDPRLRI
jgi:ABC-type dipeptide/oligopeptide/nickel transport system permease subunit